MNTKVISSIFFLGLIALFSCEKQVDLKPESDISNNSFWQNEDDVTSAFYGMYHQFRKTFDIKVIRWGDFRTGYYDHGTSSSNAWVEVWENEINPTTSGVNWADMYDLINIANLILSKSADIEFTNSEDKDNILGQVYFVRAFTYFHIVKLWGNAPIVTEGFESTEQDLTPSKCPESDIYTLVKEDIAQAISLLEPSTSKNFAGIEAVQILKADVYTWTAKMNNGGEQDLQEAKSAIEAVLSSGYELEDNFETTFRDEGSNEIIFSVYYSVEEQSEAGENPANETILGIQTTPEDLISTVPTSPNPQWVDLSEYFVNNILNPASLDSRTNVSWRREVGPQTNSEATWINKYIGENVAGSQLATDDFIIYRLAEAILFKAEIENALGNTNQALSALNRIAERAYGESDYYAGLSSEQIDEAILDERIWEFVYEGKAWYDIMRFGKSFERIPSLVGREGEKAGNILLLPVAQDVLNRNTNITQTEGY